MKTIQQAVAEKISSSAPQISDQVIELMSKTEIDRRVDLILKAIKKQDQLEADFKKIDKNDIVTYVDGAAQESMSKTRFDQIKKDKEKLERLKNEVTVALEQNTEDSYAKLSKSLNNAGSDQEKSKPGDIIIS